MRCVILTCNTGGGHNAAAKALQEAFAARGHQAEVLDYLALAGQHVSRTVGDSYIEMVKLSPRTFGAVYQLGMAVSTHTRRSPVYYANARMARYLREYFQENPVDCILMTHLFAAETLSWMKRHGDRLPLTIAVGTDYTCVPFWEETDCDCNILPHPDLAAEYCRRGFNPQTLYPLGIPVSPRFSAAYSRTQARRELGLSADRQVYLVVGGSMGAGHLGRLTRELIRLTGEEAEILVVCGSNKNKQRNLLRDYGGVPRVTILGRTDAMRAMMAAGDILFTKPGGLTSTEAAVAGIPLVHIDPIPGCETANRAFFTARGISVTGPTPQEQARAGVALLHSPEKLEAMRRAQAEQIPHFAAEAICRLAEEKAKEASVCSPS